MAINPVKIHLFNLFVKICPPSRLNSFKVRLLRWAGAQVGKNVSIFSPKILGQFEFIIGDNCWIGHDALIFGAAGSKIEMKLYSKVASRAIVVTGYHDYGVQYDCIAGPGKCDEIHRQWYVLVRQLERSHMWQHIQWLLTMYHHL